MISVPWKVIRPLSPSFGVWSTNFFPQTGGYVEGDVLVNKLRINELLLEIEHDNLESPWPWWLADRFEVDILDEEAEEERCIGHLRKAQRLETQAAHLCGLTRRYRRKKTGRRHSWVEFVASN